MCTVATCRRVLLLAGVLLAVACSSEPPESRGVNTWLDLSPVDPAEPRPEHEQLARFGADVIAGWGPELSVKTKPHGSYVELAGGSEVSFSVPQDVAAKLTRVSLVARSGVGRTFKLSVFDGERAVTSRTETIVRTVGPSLIHFPLPQLTRVDVEDMSIVFSLPSSAGTMRLYEVLLESAPRALMLPPETLDSFSPVAIAGEYRSARCLWSRAGLRAEFVAVPGDALAFAFGVPAEARTPDVRAVLVTLLQTPGREPERHEQPLDLDPAQSGSWQPVSIALDTWVGAKTTATWTIESDVEEVVPGLITRPAIRRPGQHARTVLLITSDTHRADHVGRAGTDVQIRTATLDRLADEGVFFEDALASINNTAPSHVALMSGTSPRDTGVVQNGEGITDDAVTLAERFRDAGYITMGAVSAPPITHLYSGLGQGFEHYSEPPGGPRPGQDTLAVVSEWLPQYAGLDVFIWVHAFDAHAPYEPPEDYARLYYPEDKDPFDAEGPDAVPDLAPDWKPEIADPGFTEALYKSEITHLDEVIGAFLDGPRFEQAIIAFTADHGESLRQGGVPFSHSGLSPATLAVPLILRAPGLPSGKRVQRPVRQIDIGRTLLDLAGLEEVEFPGFDLADELDRGAGEVRPRYALEANSRGASIQLHEWMLQLVFNLPPDQMTETRRRHSVHLYDIRADPYLQNDLREEQPDITRRMRELLVQWLAEASPNPWARAAQADRSEVEATLLELGYVTVERDVSSTRWFDPDCKCNQCELFR